MIVRSSLGFRVMNLTLVVLFASQCHSCTSKAPEKYRVLRKSDSDGKQLVVAVDENAKLFCMSNTPWRRCLWKPPRNGVRELRCEFTRGPNNLITCPSFPEIQYDTEASNSDPFNCAIIVKHIQEYHEGNWKCEFELDLMDQQQPIVIEEKVRLLARGYRYP